MHNGDLLLVIAEVCMLHCSIFLPHFQVNVRDPQHAKYIETTIPFKDMRSFVCEDAEDMEVFLKSVRDEQGLQINAVMAPDTALSSFKPEFPITRYR